MSIIQVINKNAYEHRKAIANAWADAEGNFELFKSELSACQAEIPDLPVSSIIEDAEFFLSAM